MIARSLFVTALVMSLLTVGCRKAAIESYRVPKEKDPEMPIASRAPQAGDTNAGGNAMANTAVPTAEGAELAWSAPADWKQQPASAMRKGSYLVKGNGGEDGDLSVTAFPGDVGGELANVNRWRGQVQLPPITEADLGSQVVQVAHNGLQFSVVDVTAAGANPKRILGAIVPYGGATWFFKLAGPDAVVGKAKPEFLDFLETVHPTGNAGGGAAADSSSAPSAPATAPMSGMNAMAQTAVPTANGADLTWAAPSEWKPGPTSAMRKGSFLVPGNGAEDGDLSITAFPGDVGGELANVNRWRGQVQLPPIADADLGSQIQRIEHDGLPFSVVDVTGSGSNAHRILGAIVPYAGATWFFKLSGPDAVVGQAKPAFLKFLQTVKPAAAQ